MTLTRTLTILSLAASVAACSTPGQTGGASLIPNKALQITSQVAIPLGSVVTGLGLAAAIHYVYDPLAPNWQIEESRLSDDTYALALTMKRFHTGGAGESIQVLKRRAARLQAEGGYGAYQIIEYTEGIDSKTIGAQRVAAGTIKLVQQLQADSFMLNQR